MQNNIIDKLKGWVDMMAKLWATEILSAETIEEAKALWARCPKLLKAKVKALLEASDAELAAEIMGASV